MPDLLTPNYHLTKPEVGASNATWGAKINADLDVIDTQMKTNANAVAAVATGGFTQVSINKTTIAAGAPITGSFGGLARWVVQLGDSASETGGNNGSNFSIQRYSDAGTLIDTPFTINRASGRAQVADPVNATDVANKEYVDARVSLTPGSIGLPSTGGGTQMLAASNGTFAPPAGTIGEPVTSGLTASGSLSNGVHATLASIPLTAGVWLLWASAYFVPGAGVNVVEWFAWVSATATGSALFPDMSLDLLGSLGQNDNVQMPIGMTVMRITAPTTFYLVGGAWFGGGPCSGRGVISAVRIA